MSAFVDTNVLVHAANEASPQPPATRIARELLLQPDLFLSVQVLSEFVVNARHPHKLNFSPEQEMDWVERWMQFPIGPLSIETFVNALQIHHRYQLPHWDSLIVAAARDMSCERIYSEDLNHGQDYGGVVVENPFRDL